MLFSSAAVALLALASQAVAEPMPYKTNARRSVSPRALFGLAPRQDDGYTPTQAYCGMGQTCAEACGSGYATCPSTDDAIHCYDPSASQSCCPGGSGVSCDSGFYCAGDAAGDTLCCPDGLSLAECAKAGGVSSLTSEIASSTSTSASSSSTSSSKSTSSSTSTKAKTTSSTSSFYSAPGNATITLIGTSYSTTPCSSTAAVTTAGSGNYTTALGGATPTPTAAATETAKAVAVSAAGFVQPASALAALIAAAFALLL